MFEGRNVTVVLAQAGAGKTHYLMQLLKEELKTRLPTEVAFVTFTKKGATEGLERACQQTGLKKEDFPFFRTIHSLTFHANSFKASQMFNHLHERKFNKQYGYKLNRVASSASNNMFVPPTLDTRCLDYYDLDRSGGLTLQGREEFNFDLAYYRQIVHDYNEFKSNECLVDFFDCLVEYVQSGSSLPCKTVFVDECQDLSALQWLVIEKAFAKAEHLYFVGDENQCIFSYSSARPDYLIEFSKRFKNEYLPMSYRLPKKVFRLARSIVNTISIKTDKPFICNDSNPEGTVTEIMDFEDIVNKVQMPQKSRKSASWYLLVRNRCYMYRYTEALQKALIPYWTAEGFFISPHQFKLLSDYENYKLKGFKSEEKKKEFMERYNITDFNESFVSSSLIIEEEKWYIKEYIDKYTLPKLKEMSMWYPQILVSTVHHIKGGEADNVAYCLDATSRTSLNCYNQLDEELRVMYVAVTRTKQNLYVIDSIKSSCQDDVFQAIKTAEDFY